MERLWAGWRSAYLDTTDDAGLAGSDLDGSDLAGSERCVFCGLLSSGLADEQTLIVWRSPEVAVVLNAYPYGSGHLLVMPVRHLGGLSELSDIERRVLWDTVHAAVDAVTAAYAPGGVNVGANLGRAAGAGIPGHLHIHVLPRWEGDTNFMTTVASTRVLPETLSETWLRVRAAWPVPDA